MILYILFTLSFISSIASQYGCIEDDTCILSSNDNNYTTNDELFCTSSVNICNIYCITPNSCQSVTIYSSAQYTNIICNASSACSNSIIRIGDTSKYPLNINPNYFINQNPTQSIITCNAYESCSSVEVYFHGSDNDDISISSTNTNSFQNGYFDCDITNNSQCTLYCSNTYNNECNHATLNCYESTINDSCQCNGAGCNSIHYIYSDDTPTTTLSDNDEKITTTTSTTINTANITTKKSAFYETQAFEYVIIAGMVIVVCCGCSLLACCWKFESIYDYIEQKRGTPKQSSLSFRQRQRAPTHESEDKSNESKKMYKYHHAHHHSQQSSQTTSNSQSAPNKTSITDEDQRTSTIEPRESTMTTTVASTQTNHHGTADSMDMTRVRMPSSWYKYQQHKQQQSTELTQTNTTAITGVTSPQSNYYEETTQTMTNMTDVMSPISVAMDSVPFDDNDENMDGNVRKNKKPQKQNKKRKRSAQTKEYNKRKESMDKRQDVKYQKVAVKTPQKYRKDENDKVRVKGKESEEYRRPHRDGREEDGDDSDSSSDTDSDTDTDTESDDSDSDESDSDTDYDSSTTGTMSSDGDSDEDEEKDGDQETGTTVNVDDMLINMVQMMQQNTPHVNEEGSKQYGYDGVV